MDPVFDPFDGSFTKPLVNRPIYKGFCEEPVKRVKNRVHLEGPFGGSIWRSNLTLQFDHPIWPSKLTLQMDPPNGHCFWPFWRVPHKTLVNRPIYKGFCEGSVKRVKNRVKLEGPFGGSFWTIYGIHMIHIVWSYMTKSRCQGVKNDPFWGIPAKSCQIFTWFRVVLTILPVLTCRVVFWSYLTILTITMI